MIIRSDNYWMLRGEVDHDYIFLDIQDEQDPDVNVLWELTADCAAEVIESLQVMVMDFDIFERIDDSNVSLSVAELWVEWVKNHPKTPS